MNTSSEAGHALKVAAELLCAAYALWEEGQAAFRAEEARRMAAARAGEVYGYSGESAFPHVSLQDIRYDLQRARTRMRVLLDAHDKLVEAGL